MSQTSHSSSQRGVSTGDGERHKSSTEYINHSNFSMLDKVLMSLVEVGLGLRPALLPYIIQMIMVDHLVSIVMVITEVNIGITPFFLRITMMD